MFEIKRRRTTAHDLMVDFQQPVHASATLREALELFLAGHEIPCVPVVDDEGNLVGLVRQLELNAILHPLLPLDAGACAALKASLAMPVEQVMATDVHVVDEDADVLEISDLMIEDKIIALPVIDATGKYLGMISHVDVLLELALHAADAA